MSPSSSRPRPWRLRAVGVAVCLASMSTPANGHCRCPVPAEPAPQEISPVAAQDSTADSVRVRENLTVSRENRDEEIRRSLQAIFDRIAALDRLDVRVEAGILTLAGIVDDSRAEDRALELASEQDGVLWVEDQIRLDSSIERQIQPTWDRLRELAIGIVARLPLYLVALLIVIFAFLIGGLAGRWGGPSFLRLRNPFLRSVVGRLLQAGVVVVGLLVALDLIEATALVGAVAGTAGLAGLALGFAFKDIVENYLAGLLMAVRQTFSKDDHIVVGEHEGLVVRLTPREAILMTLDGNHVRIPNAVVFRSALLNYSRNPRRRFQFDAGVGPVDDLALARSEGMEVLREMNGVMDEPPPEALVVELGDSWVTVRFSGWVDQRQADFLRVRSEAIRLVKARLEDAGISLPAPEYLVRLVEGAHSEADPRLKPPDASAQRNSPGGSSGAARQEDVTPDRTVQRQVEADRRTSGEEDLLNGTSDLRPDSRT